MRWSGCRRSTGTRSRRDGGVPGARRLGGDELGPAPGEAEAGPCMEVDVFGADFDYPGSERALAREARAFLERLEGGAESGGNTLA